MLKNMLNCAYMSNMTMHISKIFVVENNTVQVRIEQESYLLLHWSNNHNQQVKHPKMNQTNSEAMKKTLSAAAEDGCTSKSFSAAADQHGKSFECFFHHWRGSASLQVFIGKFTNSAYRCN